jgi:hypothetical protein
MSEDDKAPAVTIRIPARRVFAEAAARRPDARTAEVLRALHRAKGTIMGTDVPTSSPSTETLVWELRALRELLSKTSPVVEEAAQRLASCAGIIERAIIVPSGKLADVQRSQDSAVRELREALHGLARQTDVLPAWHAWWARRAAAWGLVLVVLFGVGVGLTWRAHTLAQSTHDILAQILANQESAQAAKAGKRR